MGRRVPNKSRIFWHLPRQNTSISLFPTRYGFENDLHKGIFRLIKCIQEYSSCLLDSRLQVWFHSVPALNRLGESDCRGHPSTSKTEHIEILNILKTPCSLRPLQETAPCVSSFLDSIHILLVLLPNLFVPRDSSVRAHQPSSPKRCPLQCADSGFATAENRDTNEEKRI